MIFAALLSATVLVGARANQDGLADFLDPAASEADVLALESALSGSESFFVDGIAFASDAFLRLGGVRSGLCRPDEVARIRGLRIHRMGELLGSGFQLSGFTDLPNIGHGKILSSDNEIGGIHAGRLEFVPLKERFQYLPEANKNQRAGKQRNSASPLDHIPVKFFLGCFYLLGSLGACCLGCWCYVFWNDRWNDRRWWRAITIASFAVAIIFLFQSAPFLGLG